MGTIDDSIGVLQEIPEDILPTWQDINQVVFMNEKEQFSLAQRKGNTLLREIKSLQQDKNMLQHQMAALQEDKGVLQHQVTALQEGMLALQQQIAMFSMNKTIEELPETDEPMLDQEAAKERAFSSKRQQLALEIPGSQAALLQTYGLMAEAKKNPSETNTQPASLIKARTFSGGLAISALRL